MKERYDNLDKNIIDMYVNTFNNTKEYNEIERLILIGTKILSCNKKRLSVDVDIDRLFDELRYFQYYEIRNDINILNFFLPIILSTRSIQSSNRIFMNLVEKITHFYKKTNKTMDYILELFCYDMAIRYRLGNNNDVYELFEMIREGLINFDIDFQDKKNKVNFHIKKIKYIEEVHKYIDDEDYSVNTGVLRIIRDAFLEKGGDYTDIGDISVYNTLCNNDKLSHTNQNETHVADKKSPTFYKEANRDLYTNEKYAFLKSMSEFVLKIRQYNIDIKKYQRQEKIVDFSKYKVGDEILDPILNRVKIIDSYTEDDVRIVVIDSKTGKYTFRYKIRK